MDVAQTKQDAERLLRLAVPDLRGQQCYLLTADDCPKLFNGFASDVLACTNGTMDYAMEPSMVAMLAPVVLQVIKVVLPLMVKGLKNMGAGLVDMGIEMLNFFRLPIGLFEISFLGPFGFFDDGLLDIVEGSIAPAKLIFYALTLPIRPFGALM